MKPARMRAVPPKIDPRMPGVLKSCGRSIAEFPSGASL